MRNLNQVEVDQVNGSGLTGISAGNEFAGAVGAVYAAGQVGWAIGSYISNNWLSQSAKDAIGATVAGSVNEVRSWFGGASGPNGI